MPTTRSGSILLGSIAAILALSDSLIAANIQWTGTSSTDWNTATNWSSGGLPTAPDDAFISVTPANIATIKADLQVNPRDIRVGDGAGTNGRLDHLSGTATTGTGNWFYVGTQSGIGIYNLADTTKTGGPLTGYGLGSGNTNVGGLEGTGGRLYVGGTNFGPAGGTGTLNVNTSGTLTVRNDLVAGVNGGTGVVNVDTGTITTGAWNMFGFDEVSAGGKGTFNMSGGTLTNAGRTYVGRGNSTGSFNMTGGTYNNLGDQFIIGENNSASGATSQASITGATATLNASGEIWVGQGGTGLGAMTVSVGTVAANNWIAVGRDGGTGTLNLSGTGVIRKTGGDGSHIIFGSLAGKATVTQTGGLMETVGGGDFRLGENVGAQATWNISGGTANAQSYRVGWIGGGAGTINVSGTAVLNASDAVSIAEGGPGTITQTGGRINVAGNFDVQASGANAGVYSLSGGTLSVDGLISTDNGTFTFSGGTITRSNTAGPINVGDNLTTAAPAATLGLDNGKKFTIGGTLNKTAGITLDVTGLVIPGYDGSGIDTGSFVLGSVGAILGQFGPATDFVLGLTNTPNATFISEAAGENGSFNASAQSVFWIQENLGTVTLNYSVVPEPGSAALLGISSVLLAARRRRKM